ncbi:hypothetical protein, partial [Stenotrophomonas acidaminiphila]|uniref:hypothetical protein n=1 Tax=Stenotrophomonas acidaminiphila TaxID=128780 RepID=UPI00360A56F9
ARNSSVYCLLLPINTSVIAINYGVRVSTKGWPVQEPRNRICAFVRKHGCAYAALLERADADFRKATKTDSNTK